MRQKAFEVFEKNALRFIQDFDIYENNQTYKNTYGCLYDWQTAMKASPAGWHLPTQAEYETLINYLGGLAIAGGKLKEAGFEHWKSPNIAANNSCGFRLFPGGGAHEADDEASFYAMGESCFLWCSQVKGIYEAMFLVVNYDRAHVNFHSASRSAYFSVRCIKD